MSYDMGFWAGGDDLDPAEVYGRLMDGGMVESLREVNREEVLLGFTAGLPGWRWDGQFLQPPGVAPDEAPAFDVYITEQLVNFTGYGFEGENGNAIIEVMRPLGYRLYDPQVSQRFE